jgi:hypothetical protein
MWSSDRSSEKIMVAELDSLLTPNSGKLGTSTPVSWVLLQYGKLLLCRIHCGGQ